MNLVKKINTVLIASGSGTDANAIMEAYVQGFIPNIHIVSLISTKTQADCLQKAKALNIPAVTISRKTCITLDTFNWHIASYLKSCDCQLVFLVGCIVKIFPIPGIKMYNIHPADPHNFGGNGMYGLKVHERVLANIKDLIERGKKSIKDEFFTFPTVHRTDFNYDSGMTFLSVTVMIPPSVIDKLMDKNLPISESAILLQKYVLPFEWAILPTAVKIAAQEIDFNFKK